MNQIAIPAIAVALLSLTPDNHAATIANYTFDGAGGAFANPGETTATPGLVYSTWVDTDGNGVSSADGSGSISGIRAISDSGFANGNGFAFSIGIPSGFLLSISSIAFQDRASGTGPSS